MSIHIEKHFITKQPSVDKLGRKLRCVIEKFTSTPDSLHIEMIQDSLEGHSIIKDQASYSDLDQIGNLVESTLRLRVWFDDWDGNRMYFSLGVDKKHIRLNVHSENRVIA